MLQSGYLCDGILFEPQRGEQKRCYKQDKKIKYPYGL